jgi:hypothetical protein
MLGFAGVFVVLPERCPRTPGYRRRSAARALGLLRAGFFEGAFCGPAGEFAGDVGGGAFDEFKGDGHVFLFQVAD